ncbi:hypothetical protein P23_1980 [Acinetobacter calcoaceticus]|nr:hypothetical protein P23_1980 [Acinetobacter calcoaceticus]
MQLPKKNYKFKQGLLTFHLWIALELKINPNKTQSPDNG